MNQYLTRLVKNILKNDVAARDNWMDTIRQVHDKEMELLSYTKAEYYDILFAEKLSNVHTIKRLWQLVQENFPELRGNTWEERQKQGGMVAKEMIDDKFHQLSLWDMVDEKNKNNPY